MRSLHHPLDVLTTSGFLIKDEDLLLQRRPVLRLADPAVRLHRLGTTPRLAAFEERRAQPAWRAAEHTVSAQIFGPAFEQLAREWASRHASAHTLGGAIGKIGSTVVNDPAGKQAARDRRRGTGRGRAQADSQPGRPRHRRSKVSDRARTLVGLDRLDRLDRIRGLLVARGARAASAKLLLFGRPGFDLDLTRAAAERHDVELVDPHRIWHGE
ncbi:hypothetical protein ACWEQO_29095 [Streptomyces sp. NPDC004051]